MSIIYGFLTDEFFSPNLIIDLGTAPAPEVFYLDEHEVDYFHVKAKVTDARANRLNVLGTTLAGKQRLWFDGSKVATPSLFTNITTPVHDKLFNILERISLGQDASLELVNTVLKSDAQYDIYVPDSLLASSSITSVTVVLNGVQQDIGVRDYVRFSVNVDGVVTEFKIWLSRKAFLRDYPLSTVCKIVFPCDPEYLLNPSKLTSPLDAVAKSGTYSFATLDGDIRDNEYTGMFSYATKYVTGPDSVQAVPFGVLYQGAKPNSLEIRSAIREVMTNLGIANAAVWESLFPDLFVTAEFFLIPIWDNVTVRPDRLVRPSLVKLTKLAKLTQTVLPAQEEQYITDHLELMTVGQSEIFLLALADPLNKEYFSLLALHPSYQYYHAQDPAFSYMDEKTRDFNIRLNRCIAVLMGEATSTEFVSNDFSGRKYLSFVSYGTEYHVLVSKDFPTEY